VCEAKYQDGPATQRVEPCFVLIDGEGRHRFIGLAPHRDDRVRTTAGEEEVRVNGNAMTTHSYAGLMQMGLLFRVGSRNNLSNVEAIARRIHSKLIGETNVYIAVNRFRQLTEFRGLRAAQPQHRCSEHLMIE